MAMNRRSFLGKSLPAVTFLPSLLNGFSFSAFGARPELLPLLSPIDNDHVLVIVQLSGGNDGLNTVIPLSGYDNYFHARSNVAIPEKKVLKLQGTHKTGLHPAMTPLQNLFNEGQLSIIQSVGYPNPNFSHFRSTDIWMSGSDSSTVLDTGWAGRYLHHEYPGYPAAYPTADMPDPLAIQIGSITSLTCQGPTVSMGMGITDPAQFYNLVDDLQEPAPATPMGHELSFLRQVARQTNKYADRIRRAAGKVSQQAAYPSRNYLADQLKIVARLIRGGLKTRVYLVTYGGFDTHAGQVDAADHSTGAHANLLGNLSAAIKAFTDDLRFLGVHNRVTGMTFSEFGRRIKSNDSGGTDHGAAAPVFLFGQQLASGIIGANPQVPLNVGASDNLPFQYDFRSVYASLLQQLFCVPDADLRTLFSTSLQQLPLINNPSCHWAVNKTLYEERRVSNYPNPFTASTRITYQTAGGHTMVQVIDGQGHLLQTLVDRVYAQAATLSVDFDGTGLPNGVYYVRLQNEAVQDVRPMLKVR